MIAAVIFAVSFLTLLQFFVSYCRSVIAESQQHELSEQIREICGITSRQIAGDRFRALLQLIALCPDAGGRGPGVRAVSVYFRMLEFARRISNWVIPSAHAWIDAERRGCAYVAAVALDRRITYNRMMMAAKPLN